MLTAGSRLSQCFEGRSESTIRQKVGGGEINNSKVQCTLRYVNTFSELELPPGGHFIELLYEPTLMADSNG